MATATRMKKTKTTNSTKTSTVTAAQSMIVVKNLFRAAFSTITYIRRVFPDDCFELNQIGLTRYHRLRPSSSSSSATTAPSDAATFLKWMERGIFDALQRRYLDTVHLEIYTPAQPTSASAGAGTGGVEGAPQLLEVYKFAVAYSSDRVRFELTGAGAAAPRQGADKGAGKGKGKGQSEVDILKQSTASVMLAIAKLTNELGPLPNKCFVTLTLLYTKETPDAYEPPMFHAAQDDGVNGWFDDEPLHKEVGTVTTPYHRFSMNVFVRPTAENKSAPAFDPAAAAAAAHEPRMAQASQVVSIVDISGPQGRTLQETQDVLMESQRDGVGDMEVDMEGETRSCAASAAAPTGRPHGVSLPGGKGDDDGGGAEKSMLPHGSGPVNAKIRVRGAVRGKKRAGDAQATRSVAKRKKSAPNPEAQ